MSNEPKTIRSILEELVHEYPVNPPVKGYEPKTTNSALLDQAEADLKAYVEEREHDARLNMVGLVTQAFAELKRRSNSHGDVLEDCYDELGRIFVLNTLNDFEKQLEDKKTG